MNKVGLGKFSSEMANISRGVGRLWGDKALEGQAIVCEQWLAPPMLCLLRAFRCPKRYQKKSYFINFWLHYRRGKIKICKTTIFYFIPTQPVIMRFEDDFKFRTISELFLYSNIMFQNKATMICYQVLGLIHSAMTALHLAMTVLLINPFSPRLH